MNHLVIGFIAIIFVYLVIYWLFNTNFEDLEG